MIFYRADQKNLKERRSKQKSTSISPRETIERELVGSSNNHHQEKPHHHRSKKSSSVSPTQKRRHRRQKSPHPGASQKNKDQQQQHPLVQVIANSGNNYSDGSSGTRNSGFGFWKFHIEMGF